MIVIGGDEWLNSGLQSCSNGVDSTQGKYPMIFTLENRGTVEHPRYVLMNSYGWCWDDEEQEFVKAGGTLFHDVNPACKTIRALQLAEHGHKKLRRFVAPVTLELFCDDEIDQATIENWALHATRLILHPEQGIGPGNDQSLGLVSINWGQLQEMSPEDVA
jgi:hypothetical protein